MKKLRLIPRLDIKGPNVVKGIHLEGLRVIGKPAVFAKRYYEEGADELLYIDIVASLYERNNLLDVVEETVSSGMFIPLTVGGGVRSVDDIKNILRAGGDKVAINTAATRRPEFITEASRMFGSQCIVGSIEAKRQENGGWEAYIDNGREKTGLDAIEWAKRLVELGAGELLVTSIDKEGTQKGYDLELIKKITSIVSVPVIACGGANGEESIYECLQETGCDGAAFASILHYDKNNIGEIKKFLLDKGLKVRASTPTLPESPTQRKKKIISIIDYSVGNIKSVMSAFKSVGSEVRLITTGEQIEESELLVLPGDGAFGYAMEELTKRQLIPHILKYVRSGKPLLGICLGMQILLSESLEFGRHKGLGIIKGRVLPFIPKSELVEKFNGESYNVPHMGWNTLQRPEGISWKDTILSDVKDQSEAYFVHSFYVIPSDRSCVLATTCYGNQEFCTVIKKENVYGTQFHPEKSGKIGMIMLENFSNL